MRHHSPIAKLAAALALSLASLALASARNFPPPTRVPLPPPRPAAVEACLAEQISGGSPLLKQGEAGLQSSGTTLALKMGFSPGISRPIAPPQQPQPPSDAEIRERTAKVVANQHHDDEAIEQYERLERHVEQTAGNNPRILDEKTYRVVPTGLGTMKLLLKDNDKPADPADYLKQLQALKDTLELVLKPDDYRTKAASAKWQKKAHDRAELVDAAHEAFTIHWIARETFRGRLCDIIELNPDPNFHPHGLYQEAFAHVNVKIWVDLETNQLARGEARVTRDLSFGGGILGKLYRGGVFSLEQSEIAPGLWLPSRYQYDYTARKFLFTSEQHQYIEVSRFRLVGPPKQALAMVLSELAGAKSGYGDP